MSDEIVRIEKLSKEHNRRAFSCGVASLDTYLRTLARQDVKRNVATCFVAVESSGFIVGYYTLAAASIPLPDLPEELSQKLPSYPNIPAACIGRLAVDTRRRNLQYGGALLADALTRIRASDIAVYATVVDAISDEAAAFYLHYGFQRFMDDRNRLFIPMSHIPC